MTRIAIAGLLTAVAFVPARSQKAASGLAGRWDLTVATSQDTYPSWFEFTEITAVRQSAWWGV